MGAQQDGGLDGQDGESGFGPGLTAEAAFRLIAQRCGAEIDAHLAYVLERDDAEGPHKARVWLRRLVVALDAFAPILKRRAKAGLRDEAKAIFRILGKLRDRDVLMARLGEAELSPKLVDATSRLREKVRARLRERSAVLFSPVMLRAVEEGALFRAGPEALALRAGPVEAIAVGALDLAWESCRKQKGDLRRIDPEALHGFRKRLKTLRYLSEFFAPFLNAQGAEPFRAALQRMQDVLGVATDAEAARALGKKSWGLVDKAAVRDALDQAGAIWEALLLHRPWWRGSEVRH